MIVLSAGASTRMGFPKALAEVPGGTLLGAHLAPRAFPLEGICVVLGAHGAEIAAAVDPRGARFVHHPGWAQGQSSSLRAGLSTLPPGAAAFVTPVDCPPVSDPILAGLAESLLDGDSAVLPTHGGRGGHPVLLAAPTIAAFLAERPPPPLNAFLAGRPAAPRTLEVADPSILWNLNHPEDLAAFRASLGG